MNRRKTRFLMRAPHARTNPLNFKGGLGRALAPVLALALFASMFPASAAQKGANAPAEVEMEVSTYVISRTPEGELSCELLSPEEASAYAPASGQEVELHQINHLDEAGGAKSPYGAAATTGLTIILRGTDQLEQNQEAKQAFIAAAARWESLIQNPITVVIDVDYGATFFGQAYPSENTLGQTSSPRFSCLNYGSTRQALINTASTQEETIIFNALPASNVPTDLGPTQCVSVTTPNARAFPGLTNLSSDARNDPTTTPQPRIGFNSSFGFDFNPADGITGNRTDFDAVAVHEIGHALGFTSQVGARELTPEDPIRVSLWDLLRFRPGVTLASLGIAERILSTGGEHRHFDGVAERSLSTGNPEAKNGDLRQASHWKDDSYTGTYIGIMDPTIPRNTRRVVTEADRRAIELMGYQTQAVPAPANDNFANAQQLTGASGTVSGTNNGATREAGEPNHASNAGGRSVWYQWTAAQSGNATFDTVGSTFDTTLAVYTGASVSSLTHVASNDDIQNGVNQQSRVTFTANAGTTYRIAVDGWDAAAGQITLNWSTQFPTAAFSFAGPGSSFSEAVGSIVVTVTRTNAALAQSVSYATANASAHAGSDYVAMSGTLNFAPGVSSQSISIPIIDDAVTEEDESFSVSLSNPTNGAIIGFNPTAVLTILNDDIPPPASVQFTAAAVTVGEGTGSVTLTVTRTGNVVRSEWFSYLTNDGTATVFASPPDYVGINGVIAFGPGETQKSITVQVNNDTLAEASETFSVTIKNLSSGLILGTPSTAVVTITDDDTLTDSTVQFSAAQLDVQESAGHVTVTVTRTGNTSGPASVSYITSDGTATDRSDYLTAAGTLYFAGGETQKTFDVFLVDDAYGDGNTNAKGDQPLETFTVALSNPLYCTLGQTQQMTVRIANNEAADGANPVSDGSFVGSFFVRQHYIDFLNREPDAGGLAFWTNQTTGCGNTDLLVCRINVSAAFFVSPEFQETGFYVLRAQRVAFGKKSVEESTRVKYIDFVRDARQVGEGFIDGQPGSAQTLDGNKQLYAVRVISSGQFAAAFPNTLTSAQFVDALYAKAGVTPTVAERQEAIQAFENALPDPLMMRVAAFRRVADSQSVRAAEFREAFVLMQYFGYLRRDPDQPGYAFWLSKLNQFNGNYIDAEMVKAFITSGEYIGRFGQ